MKLIKKFDFSAAHFLNDYIGKCRNMHGHTWEVEMIIDYIPKEFMNGSEVLHGMLIDFGNMKNIIDNLFDHKTINDIVTFNPTAENLAAFICIIAKLITLNALFGIDDKPKLSVIIKLWESKTACVEMDIESAKNWLNISTEEDIKKYLKNGEKLIF